MHGATLTEGAVAVRTNKRLLASVNADVFVESTLVVETTLTRLTLVLLMYCVLGVLKLSVRLEVIEEALLRRPLL